HTFAHSPTCARRICTAPSTGWGQGVWAREALAAATSRAIPPHSQRGGRAGENGDGGPSPFSARLGLARLGGRRARRLRLLGSALAPGGVLRLRRLERGQLLLGRQLPALGHDERLHLGDDALVDVDRDRVAADPLDRVDPDLAAVDADLARAPD